jgi:N-acetylneuraminate synthase
MTYLAYKYKVEFGQSEYDEIDKYCKEKGIEWSASPWDLDSLEFLEQYDLPWLKIPSAMLTEESLLRECAKTGKKIIFSVGMSNLDEIDRAVEILREEQAEFAMLHCNSTYPAPLEELNLKAVMSLELVQQLLLYILVQQSLRDISRSTAQCGDRIIWHQ